MESDFPPGVPGRFARESDADLMVYMAMGREDPEAAREAWAEFYQRHVGYLYAVCRRAYAPILGGEAGASDLVADTFLRAYESAGTFDAGGLVDPERLRRRTRAWLGRIAQRLALTLLRGRGFVRTARVDVGEWLETSAPEPVAAAESERISRVRQAIERLSDKEQIVIRVTFEWHEPGKPHQRLPNDVAEELAATLQTTPENLRQIRRRALKKIREFLEKGDPHDPA
jgi:RNA polymerase sigma factor (sigma-70 family)